MLHQCSAPSRAPVSKHVCMLVACPASHQLVALFDYHHFAVQGSTNPWLLTALGIPAVALYWWYQVQGTRARIMCSDACGHHVALVLDHMRWTFLLHAWDWFHALAAPRQVLTCHDSTGMVFGQQHCMGAVHGRSCMQSPCACCAGRV